MFIEKSQLPFFEKLSNGAGVPVMNQHNIVSRLVVAALLAGLAIPAAAQAPHITPQGDPSVKPDSIYRLAVNPADRPEETAAFLLDDGVLRLDADGKGTRTFRQIVQILRPEAAENYREQRFSYAPKHQKFTLNWIHVVKPDGTIISEKPAQIQESDVPAQLGDPTYSDRKVVRVSVTGVEAGTIVDYSYTTEELQPFLPGDFYETWGVSTGLSVRRSRYIVDVPESFTPRIHEENLNFPRKESTAAGRHVYMWTTADLPKIKPEVFAADSNAVYMSVQLSSPTTWAQIGKWYADNAKARYTLTPDVEKTITGLVKDAHTLDDSIRAVHRWVAQDIRYVSIALGLGGYQPRAPEEVVRTGFGDCKDKATLFVTALKHFGVTAYPVILNSSGGVRRDMPSIEQLDHAIAAYKRPGHAGYEFTDLTSEFTPLGELPFGYQGDFGLVVHLDGTTEQVTFPKAPLTDNRTERRIVGTVSPEGIFDGHYEEAGFGGRQYELRGAFQNPFDSTQKAKVATQLASSLFSGAEGDSLVGFKGKDLAAPPRMSVRIMHGKAASMAGSNAIFTNPFGTMEGFAAGAKEIESVGQRRFPIDAQKIFGYGETVLQLRLTLPAGWHAQLPASVVATSAFGNYRAEYAQTGRELTLTRTITGSSAKLPPDQMKSLTAWMREIARDDAKLIVIDRSATVPH
jgi:transglutaminase-like putative cysteine protease